MAKRIYRRYKRVPIKGRKLIVPTYKKRKTAKKKQYGKPRTRKGTPYPYAFLR